jgi:hypothetical protein
MKLFDALGPVLHVTLTPFPHLLRNLKARVSDLCFDTIVHAVEALDALASRRVLDVEVVADSGPSLDARGGLVVGEVVGVPLDRRQRPRRGARWRFRWRRGRWRFGRWRRG